MEKQEKVLKKFNKTNGYDRSMIMGKKNNDECYTPYDLIMAELVHWGALDKFRGKNIICPCDWDIDEDNQDIYSICITYKDEDVEVVANDIYKAVKNVQVKLWSLDEDNNPVIKTLDMAEDEIEDFLRNKLTCNFVRVLTAKARVWGIKSITASGYNPALDRGFKFEDVDYSKYDVCITNPPFSLYSKFMDCVVGNIDYIVLAPGMNRANPSVGLRLMLGEAYLGYTFNLMVHFLNPTVENNYKIKRVLCDWITSFSEAQEERNKIKLSTGISYELYKDEYEVIPNMVMKDGTCPIHVKKGTLPDDYDGWMFGDVFILDLLSLDEFEWYGTNFFKYFNTISPENSPFLEKLSNATHLKLDGKYYFAGIVFRRRK